MQSWGRWLGRGVVASLLLLLVVAGRHEQYSTVFGETACKRNADLCDDGGGVMVEQGPPQDVIANPQHPRTRTFLTRLLEPI